MELKKSIKSVVEDTITKHITPTELRPRVIGHYNASEMGTCYREWYYRYKYPLVADTDLLGIFQCGHIFHNFVDEVFANSDDVKLIANEKALLMMDNESGAVLHGRLDNLIEYEGVKYIIDTKTTKMISNYPISETYKMQLMPYMKMFNIQKGGILYIEKNTLNKKFIEVDYDEELLKYVFERLRVINSHLEDDTLPAKEAAEDKSKKWACRFCQYKDKCDMDVN